MNWEAIGSISDFLAAITVVTTLFYLAHQLKISNRLTREDAHFRMLSNQTNYHNRIAENSDLTALIYGTKTEAETKQVQRRAQAISIFFIWNWEYLRSLEGTYEKMDVPVAGFRHEFASANLFREWEALKHIYDPRFIEFINQEVLKGLVEPSTDNNDSSPEKSE